MVYTVGFGTRNLHSCGLQSWRDPSRRRPLAAVTHQMLRPVFNLPPARSKSWRSTRGRLCECRPLIPMSPTSRPPVPY
jgi:hypothetical protein